MLHLHTQRSPFPLARRFAAMLALTVLAASAAAAGPKEPDPSHALHSLAERYYEAQARLDPLYSATLIGDNRFDDALPLTISPAHRQRRFAMYRDMQRQLARIVRARLDETDALTHELLDHELRRRLGFETFPDHLLPLHHMDAVPRLLATFGAGQSEQPLQTVPQYEAYLARIGQLPGWTTQAIANLREGQRRGIVLPRPVAEIVLVQLRGFASAPTADSPFHAPIRNLPASFSASDRQRLTTAYRRAIDRRVAPAMRRLAAYFEHHYLPACRDTAGWGALPDGAAWYRQWIREQTTTDLGPDEIHDLGLNEVARIQDALRQLAPALGYQGDPRQLLAWVREQPKFLPFRSEAQVLGAYRALDARIRMKLPYLFARAPKAALDIRPVPEMLRATASDYYALPAEDGSRPGIFWAVINDPAAYDVTAMTALFLHEGQPGHHFQMARQQEMTLPQFRKRLWINAFAEGWALYAESLGSELGLYDDPAAHVGFLRLEMARAARLVVDTGLHAKGWTRDQAVSYWMDTVGATEAQARNQIHRYMAWPAQALGYKLGALRIQALRERAQRSLGQRFDLAAFHEVVLGEGALPLSLLEARVERWIDLQRQ
jgi:uncharacterized protein (DUF885 family)